MKAIALLAFLPLVLAMQDDSERLRAAKIKALDPWLGKWKAVVEIVGGPLELRSAKMGSGEVQVRQDLGGTALRFDGWAKSDPPNQSSKTLHITGVLSFNHAAPYAEQSYTATFFWSEDGRTATAKGDYVGKELRMDVRLSPEDHRLRLRVTGDNPRTVVISIPATGRLKEEDWIKVTLRRG